MFHNGKTLNVLTDQSLLRLPEMAIRPSFQFYPDAWISNAKLKRCSHELKGIWIDIICLLHDSDEYGVLRWPLEDIAQAVGTTKTKVQKLADYGILCGGPKDTMVSSLVHVAKDKSEEILIESCEGPLWFSPRLIKDEHFRQKRGSHGSKSVYNDNVPKKKASKDTIGRSMEGSIGVSPPTPSPTPSPSPEIYMDFDDMNPHGESPDFYDDIATRMLYEQFIMHTHVMNRMKLPAFKQGVDNLLRAGIPFQKISDAYMDKANKTKKVWFIDEELMKSSGVIEEEKAEGPKTPDWDKGSQQTENLRQADRDKNFQNLKDNGAGQAIIARMRADGKSDADIQFIADKYGVDL